MIFDRIGILRTLFPVKSVAGEVANRWSKAAAAEPELVSDVLRLSRLLTVTPDDYSAGVPLGAPVDPIRLAIEHGRQDMARQLLALMGVSNFELRELMEDEQ